MTFFVTPDMLYLKRDVDIDENAPISEVEYSSSSWDEAIQDDSPFRPLTPTKGHDNFDASCDLRHVCCKTLRCERQMKNPLIFTDPKVQDTHLRTMYNMDKEGQNVEINYQEDLRLLSNTAFKIWTRFGAVTTYTALFGVISDIAHFETFLASCRACTSDGHDEAPILKKEIDITNLPLPPMSEQTNRTESEASTSKKLAYTPDPVEDEDEIDEDSPDRPYQEQKILPLFQDPSVGLPFTLDKRKPIYYQHCARDGCLFVMKQDPDKYLYYCARRYSENQSPMCDLIQDPAAILNLEKRFNAKCTNLFSENGLEYVRLLPDQFARIFYLKKGQKPEDAVEVEVRNDTNVWLRGQLALHPNCSPKYGCRKFELTNRAYLGRRCAKFKMKVENHKKPCDYKNHFNGWRKSPPCTRVQKDETFKILNLLADANGLFSTPGKGGKGKKARSSRNNETVQKSPTPRRGRSLKTLKKPTKIVSKTPVKAPRNVPVDIPAKTRSSIHIASVNSPPRRSPRKQI